MSILGFSDPDKLYKKSTHRRNYSGEVDVFEAARYFGGSGNDASGCYSGTGFRQKTMSEEKQAWRSGERTNKDMTMRNTLPFQTYRIEKQSKEKKHKQPSSPGGRLASFLNSLFNQATSYKKKKSKSTTQSMKDGEESPGGKRKRRNSISHFGGFSSSADSKSIYSSSSSGFRTPPPYANTRTNVYTDQKQVMPQSKYNEKVSSLAWLDEKLKFLEKKKFNDKILQKDRIWGDQYPTEKKDFDRFQDDGEESDSSSDLFELPNHDFRNYYSRELPVYETTHMDDIIKRGAPIVNGLM